MQPSACLGIGATELVDKLLIFGYAEWE